MILAAIIFFSDIALAQWIKMNGPCAVSVNCMIINDTNIYAGTHYMGIYRKHVNGSTWLNCSNGFFGLDVESMSTLGGLLFATNQNGIYVSSDNGENWVFKTSAYQKSTIVTYGQKLFLTSVLIPQVRVSTNYGNNWTDIYSGLGNENVLSLTVKQNNYFVGTQTGKIFRSTNYGQNWSEFGSGFSGQNIKCLISDDVYIYAGTNNGIYRSSDNGLSYSRVLEINNIQVLKKYNGNLYSGSDGGGLYVSSNNGTNWSTLNNSGICTDLYIHSVVSYNNDLYAGSYVSGIAYSSNAGQSWSMQNSNFNNTNVTAIFKAGSYMFSGSFHAFNGLMTYGNGAFRSSDNGINWQSINSGLTFFYISGFCKNDSFLYIATHKNVYRSSNNGDNWVLSKNGLLDSNIYCIACSGNNVYAGIPRGLYISRNNGINWFASSFPVTTKVGSVLAYGNIVFVGSSDGTFKSTDNGINWIISDNIGGYEFARSNGIIYRANPGYGIYRTTNEGVSWNLLGTSGLTNLNITALAAFNNYICVGCDRGFYFSSNSGSTWSIKNQGFPFNPYTNGILIEGNFVYSTVDGESIWRRSLFDLTYSYESSLSFPDGFSLCIFPNPFNPVSKIKYQVPEFSSVNISVYDLTGRLIATLVDKRLAAGTYEAVFDGAGLSSGVYFCRITASDERKNVLFSDVKKMILLK